MVPAKSDSIIHIWLLVQENPVRSIRERVLRRSGIRQTSSEQELHSEGITDHAPITICLAENIRSEVGADCPARLMTSLLHALKLYLIFRKVLPFIWPVAQNLTVKYCISKSYQKDSAFIDTRFFTPSFRKFRHRYRAMVSLLPFFRFITNYLTSRRQTLHILRNPHQKLLRNPISYQRITEIILTGTVSHHVQVPDLQPAGPESAFLFRSTTLAQLLPGFQTLSARHHFSAIFSMMILQTARFLKPII